MNYFLLKLNSTVPNGVGSPEAGCIEFIYSILLEEFGQDQYGHIHIHQIADELSELILKMEGGIYVNLRYPIEACL